jgi:hypothetical protein
MCRILKVRYACKHLGRTLGTKNRARAPLIREWETQGIIPKTKHLYQHCKNACQREKDCNEVEYDERSKVCPRCKRKQGAREKAEAKGKGKGKAEGSKSSKGKSKSSK